MDGKRASSSARPGNAFPGHAFWSQPFPSSQSPWKLVRGAFASRCTTSSIEAEPSSRAVVRLKPSPEIWACASTNPGTTVAEPRSTTRASGPAAASTSSREPTARIVSPRTARAWANGRAASSVRTRFAT